MSSIEEKITRATLDLFATLQYDGMTIPLIAKKAKVGVGTVYNYFENKEFLVNQIYRQVFTDAIAAITDEDAADEKTNKTSDIAANEKSNAVTSAADANEKRDTNAPSSAEPSSAEKARSYKERFARYYKRLFAFSVAKKNMILFLKYNSRARYISDASKQARQALVDFLVEFMNEGKAAGVIKDIPEALYIPIIYAPIEMLVTNASKHEVDDMNQYLDQMLAFTWETLSTEKTASLPA